MGSSVASAPLDCFCSNLSKSFAFREVSATSLPQLFDKSLRATAENSDCWWFVVSGLLLDCGCLVIFASTSTPSRQIHGFCSGNVLF